MDMKTRRHNESSPKLSRAARERRQCERGYTLVVLLALMSILALFALAAAPNIARQAQREREEEAIFRGQQVADAIRLYYIAHGRQGVQSLPTSMDQLLEGIPRGTQKVQILRPEAARDPLTSSGEWKLIRPTDRVMLDFSRAVILYAGNQLPKTSEPSLEQNFVARFASIVNTDSKESAPGGEDDSINTSGPFIGVASRSKNSSIITYYGIDRHDQWVFTPLFK